MFLIILCLSLLAISSQSCKLSREENKALQVAKLTLPLAHVAYGIAGTAEIKGAGWISIKDRKWLDILRSREGFRFFSSDWQEDKIMGNQKFYVGYANHTKEHGTALVIAFPGSRTFWDWTVNAQRITKHFMRGVWSHRGFVNRYNELKGAIKTQTEAILNGNRELRKIGKLRIYITGHSLGGAMANLCFYDMISNWNISGVQKIILATFGSPRVFTEETYQKVDNLMSSDSKYETYRFVNDDDGITNLPRNWLVLPGSYYHVGNAFAITKHPESSCGKVTIKKEHKDYRIAVQWKVLTLNFWKAYGGHIMNTSYWNNVQKIIGGSTSGPKCVDIMLNCADPRLRDSYCKWPFNQSCERTCGVCSDEKLEQNTIDERQFF